MFAPTDLSQTGPKVLWLFHLNVTQTHNTPLSALSGPQASASTQFPTDESSLCRPSLEHCLHNSITFTFKQTQMKRVPAEKNSHLMKALSLDNIKLQ